MLERERQKIILRLLRQNGFISVKEMVRTLGASEATIRRDLTELADQGLIERIRGGAEVTGESTDAQRQTPPRLAETPLEYRKELMLDKKRAIAQKAVSLIGTDETIIIDGGSTTYWMAESLTTLRIQVITNSFAIAEYLLKNSQNTVICSSGIVYPDSQIILNPFENDIFSHYSASKVFMGVRGIDERGATNSDPLLIQTEREMIERGKELILLADSSKFSTSGPFHLCGFEKISAIITDSDLPDDKRELILSKNVRLEIAG
jgi:DeoR family transcriptional regulator, ulaG and ulaABCDEF operon transcriptional repressor